MFQHLDDPTPLPPSTVEQRRATIHRGASIQRRRRAKVFAAAAAVVAIIGAFALSPALRGGTVDPPVVAAPSSPVVASPSPSAVETATFGPGRGTGVFWGSDPEISATFTMPAGWATEGGYVYRRDADVTFGLVFVDVANIFTDGCRWKTVDPEPGPTVDDLVSAFAQVPGIKGTARNITVDGFRGTLLEYTVPDYNEDDCTEGRFGIVREDGFASPGPNLWAQVPRQQNQIRILDVNGTRLVIITTYLPKTSAADRRDLDAILESVVIG